MEFTSEEYRNTDFRAEQDQFTRFYYDEVSTAPGITWCTEYHYRKLPDGKYRFVMIDSFDNELYCHTEYENAKEFAEDIKLDSSGRELEPYIDREILALFPNDLRRKKEEMSQYFSEFTAALISDALENGDRNLVRALLPDFSEVRKNLYPDPYIPGISRKELERKRNMYREYFRSLGYEEEKPDYFIRHEPRACRKAFIDEYEIRYSTSMPCGGSSSSVLLEDAAEVKNEK